MPKLKRERPYQSIRLLDLTTDSGLAGLRDRLVKGERPTLATLAAVDCALQGGAETCIVEEGYADRDHSASYSSFYVRSFQDVPRRTTRLHFFSRKLRRNHLEVLDRDDIRTRYLGFVVLRPLAARICGRSVLVPNGDQENHFSLAMAEYDVSLAGTTLRVRGSPFMEQDARVAACATASIWMSAESLASRLRMPIFTTSEITEFATAFTVGRRALPSSGLAPEQMSEAFRRIGFDPATEWVATREQALERIYPYVESGLAPVLMLQVATGGGHAVVCVGHTYDPDLNPSTPTSVRWKGDTLDFWRSWQWVDGFLVNDDQRGPYRSIRFLERDEIKSEFKRVYGRSPPPFAEKWKCPVVIDGGLIQTKAHWPDLAPPQEEELADLHGAIVPIPAGISLSPEEAHKKAARIISIWYNARKTPLPDNIHLRTYLARGAEFKNRMSELAELHPYARRLCRGKNLPRWLWVTEMATVEMVARKRAAEHQIRGEILLDANGNPESPDFVWLHMPIDDSRGHLTTMLPHDTEADDARLALRSGWLLLEDDPYFPFLR